MEDVLFDDDLFFVACSAYSAKPFWRRLKKPAACIENRDDTSQYWRDRTMAT